MVNLRPHIGQGVLEIYLVNIIIFDYKTEVSRQFVNWKQILSENVGISQARNYMETN